MGLFPHRLSPNSSAAQTAWQQVLDWAGIAAYLPRRYATLSGGEQQRVHLARVWLQVLVAPHPVGRYLLLDEPTAALDIEGRALVTQLVAEHRARGGMVIAAIHGDGFEGSRTLDISELKTGAVA